MSSKPRLWTKGFILDTLVNFLIYIIYYMLMVRPETLAAGRGKRESEA